MKKEVDEKRPSHRERMFQRRWRQGMWTLDECLAAGYSKRDCYAQAGLGDMSSTEEEEDGEALPKGPEQEEEVEVEGEFHG